VQRTEHPAAGLHGTVEPRAPAAARPRNIRVGRRGARGGPARAAAPDLPAAELQQGRRRHAAGQPLRRHEPRGAAHEEHNVLDNHLRGFGEAFAALPRLTSLQLLGLLCDGQSWGSYTLEAHWPALHRLRRLEVRAIPRADVAELAAALPALTVLQELCVRHCQVGAEVAARVCWGLEATTALTRLEISADMPIDEDGNPMADVPADDYPG
jgi:hypothetical protein